MGFAIRFVGGVIFWAVALAVIERVAWKARTKHGK